MMYAETNFFPSYLLFLASRWLVHVRIANRYDEVKLKMSTFFTNKIYRKINCFQT